MSIEFRSEGISSYFSLHGTPIDINGVDKRKLKHFSLKCNEI